MLVQLGEEQSGILTHIGVPLAEKRAMAERLRILKWLDRSELQTLKAFGGS